MVRSATIALFVSLLLHGLIAAALIAYFECAPQPDVSVSLDLTRVELSFAEQVEETAVASPVIPSAGRLVHKPPQNEKPPEVKPEGAQPPDPPALIFPEPFEATALAAPRQARIDAPPSPKRTIRPDYPRGARRRGEQGDVLVGIRIGADGAVEDAAVVASSGFAELDAAAVKAVKAVRFTPARTGGAPVASTAQLKLSFRLKE